MAVVTVAWNGTRLDAADSGSTTANIGGGAGAGAEPDILYQGSGATPEDVSRKVGTSAAGFWITFTSTDVSTATGTYTTGVLKYAAANAAALETLATPGMEARFGSGTGAYAQYDFAGNDNYPEKGGFIFLCVDPNISGYRTATSGSPNFASATHSGIVGDFTATSKSENLVQSAVDFGDGYTVTGGGGADPTADYSDISSFNSTLANRHGFFFALEGQDGAFGQYGTVVWGSSATAVDYQDTSAPTVFLLDGFFAAGWSGIEDNVQNASTVIAPVGGTFISRGSAGGTTDTRGVYNVTGSTATASRTSQRFVNFAEFNAGSSFTYDDLDIQTADFGQNACEYKNGIIRTTSATGVGACNDATFGTTSGLHDMEFIQEGAGHAIDRTTTGTISAQGVKFTDYGPALIEFDATSSTVVNATLDQLDLPASHGYATEDEIYYQAQGGTTIGLTDGNSYFVRAVDADSLSFHNSASDATNDLNRVALNTGTGTQEIASAAAALYNSSGGAVTYNVTGGGDTPSVRNSNGSSTTVNNAVTITLNGLIAGSTVYIRNTTDGVDLFKEVEATTQFQDTVNFTTNKDLLIRVRKHSTAPFYQDFETTGTLTAQGFTLNVNQILDQ